MNYTKPASTITPLESHIFQGMVIADGPDFIVFGHVVSKFTHLRRVACEGRGPCILTIAAPDKCRTRPIVVPFAVVHVDANADDGNDCDQQDDRDRDVPRDQCDYHAAC